MLGQCSKLRRKPWMQNARWWRSFGWQPLANHAFVEALGAQALQTSCRTITSSFKTFVALCIPPFCMGLLVTTMWLALEQEVVGSLLFLSHWIKSSIAHRNLKNALRLQSDL